MVKHPIANRKIIGSSPLLCSTKINIERTSFACKKNIIKIIEGDYMKILIFLLFFVFVSLISIGLYTIHVENPIYLMYGLIIPIYFLGIFFIFKIKNKNII